MICFTLMKVDRTENLAKQTKKIMIMSLPILVLLFSVTLGKNVSVMYFFILFLEIVADLLYFFLVFFFFAVRPRSLLLLSLREVIILLQLSYPTFFVYEAVLQREISPSC